MSHGRIVDGQYKSLLVLWEECGLIRRAVTRSRLGHGDYPMYFFVG